MNLDEIVDELYGLRPSEFTAARDARAAEARANGERDTSTAIKQLRRPTAGAFLVNLLARERAQDLDALVELGEGMRRAQAEGEGDELRRLSQERRRSVAALAKEAARVSGDHGQEATAGALQELEGTLEAAVADTEAAAAVRSGRLTTALQFSGFGAVDLSGALAAPPADRAANPRERASSSAAARTKEKAASRPSPSKAKGGRAPQLSGSHRRSRRLEAADGAVREAEEALAAATAEADRLDGRLADARRDEEACRRERRELEGRLKELRRSEEAADRELKEAKAAVQVADRARRAARRRLEQAEAARRRLE